MDAVYLGIMSRASNPRPYRKRKRAEKEEETRLRITEAVVELHRTVGPARTTVTEVAELARVSRMTVYNHFPTEAELIQACSSHWLQRHPFPDPARWSGIADPAERLRAAITDFYGWYGAHEDMMANIFRDTPMVEALGSFMDAHWWPMLEGVVDLLVPGWTFEAGRELEFRAVVRLLLTFPTWRAFRDSGIEAERAAGVAVRMVRGGLGPTS
jgi:AcrR family transcriptional regulator